jgi:hypothetical protein
MNIEGNNMQHCMYIHDLYSGSKSSACFQQCIKAYRQKCVITNLFLYYILRLSVYKRYQIPMGQSKMDNPEKNPDRPDSKPNLLKTNLIF